jgi:hypothetical protein
MVLLVLGVLTVLEDLVCHERKAMLSLKILIGIWLAFFAWLAISGFLASRIVIPYLVDPLLGGRISSSDEILAFRFLVVNFSFAATALCVYLMLNFINRRFFPGKTFWGLISEAYEQTLKLKR